MSLRQTLLHAAAASVTISEGVVSSLWMVSFPSLAIGFTLGSRGANAATQMGALLLGGMLRVYHTPDLQASGSASCTVVGQAVARPPLRAPTRGGAARRPSAQCRAWRRSASAAAGSTRAAATRARPCGGCGCARMDSMSSGPCSHMGQWTGRCGHAFMFDIMSRHPRRAPGPAAARGCGGRAGGGGVSPVHGRLFVKGGHELQRAAGVHASAPHRKRWRTAWRRRAPAAAHAGRHGAPSPHRRAQAMSRIASGMRCFSK